jgi:dihydrofolate reductase
MRRIVLHMMTTADGFIADSQGKLGGWTNWDEEMRAFYNDEIFAASDTIMYGRRIYEEMVPAWTAIADLDPLEDETITEGDVTFGKRVRAMKKIVVSTTLEAVGRNAIVVRDNIPERIMELKMIEGPDILLYCGPRLVATLTGLGLIDEYMLYVNPILLGHGTRLFGDLHGALQLTLLKTKIFGSGVVLNYYEPIYPK